jgi:hypothetical protein
MFPSNVLAGVQTKSANEKIRTALYWLTVVDRKRSPQVIRERLLNRGL